MKLVCPVKECNSEDIIKYSSYYRKSDARTIQCFKCKACGRKFSSATFSKAYNQNKRQINWPIYVWYCSGVSIRRLATNFKISKTTALRKIEYMGMLMKDKNKNLLKQFEGAIGSIQFDELLTILHTKCKPLSVAMTVETKFRLILGFEVSQSPPTGRLAKIARAKYGRRPSKERSGIQNMLKNITPYLNDEVLIESDQKFIYKPCVIRNFKDTEINYNLIQYKGKKARRNGLGELKKGVNDPLFSINHTFAMLRANINRLFRKTWCTTKKVDNLIHHLEMYMYYHNTRVIQEMKKAEQKMINS